MNCRKIFYKNLKSENIEIHKTDKMEAIEHNTSLNSLLVDALPYIDHGYDEPGVREAVRFWFQIPLFFYSLSVLVQPLNSCPILSKNRLFNFVLRSWTKLYRLLNIDSDFWSTTIVRWVVENVTFRKTWWTNLIHQMDSSFP